VSVSIRQLPARFAEAFLGGARGNGLMSSGDNNRSESPAVISEGLADIGGSGAET